MKLIYLIPLLTIIGCSQSTPTTYDVAVVNIPSDDPNHREIQLQFQTPPDAQVEVTSDGGDKQTVNVDRLNSSGMFKVTLSVTRNKPSEDGTQTFTTLIRLESPNGAYVGGPSTYTVDSKTSLDDMLVVTASPATIPYGVPHTVGQLNGKPITLVVKSLAESP